MTNRLLNQNFILLWLGQGVSQLGAGIGYIATLWWVQSTTGSALALGALATVSGLVGFALSPFAGVFVDRWNRKNIIVTTDIIRGVVNCLLAFLIWRNMLTLPILLVAAAIKSACAQFFSPAVMAAVPQIVERDQLEKANALQQVTQNVCSMMGYALGGVMVATLGIPVMLLVNGIAYLLSALSEVFISLEHAADRKNLSPGVFFRDLRDGFRYIKREHALFGVMQVMVIINFAFVPFFVLLPRLVSSHLKAGSEVLGFISSSQMAGMLIGALIVSLTPFVKKNSWVIRWGLCIQACVLMLSPLAPGTLWPAQLFIYGTYGVFASVVQIFFFSTLQRKIDPAYMGKVFSLNNAMSLGLQPLSSTLSGYLGDIYPLTLIYTIFGSLVLLGNVRLLAIPGLDEYFEMRRKDGGSANGSMKSSMVTLEKRSR